MKTSIFSLTITLTLMVLASCATPENLVTDLPASATPAAISTQPTTATLTPTPGADRYFNEEGGFSLELPDGWTVIGPIEASDRLDRLYNLYVLGVDPVLNGGPGSSRIAILDAALWTPEDFALAQCSTCVEQEFTDIVLDSKPARRLVIGGGGVPFMTTWVFIEHGEHLIALAIHDPGTLEPLEEVIQSISFN